MTSYYLVQHNSAFSFDDISPAVVRTSAAAPSYSDHKRTAQDNSSSEAHIVADDTAAAADA